MIFFPAKEFSMKPETFGLKAEDVFFVTSDKIKLHAWFLPVEHPKAYLIFFHGNAGNISIRLPKASEWVKRGVSVLLVDYRGYGKSQGEIRAGKDLTLDAEAAINWLKAEKKVPTEQMILYGESIGAVPVIELAEHTRFKSLILEAPFTSLKDMAKLLYGMAPDFMLKDFEMDNETNIAKIKTPVLVVHGTEDEVVPFAMGRKVFESAPEPKRFIEIRSARHNDIAEIDKELFYQEPFEFALSS